MRKQELVDALLTDSRVTLEEMCDMNGGMESSDTWTLPRKFVKRFPQIQMVWGDSPVKGLRFEVPINSDGNTRYIWVRFV